MDEQAQSEKITRIMPLKDCQERGSISLFSDKGGDRGVYPLCKKCGREGALDEEAYLQVLVDYKEVDFICLECNGNEKTILDLVREADDQGYTMYLNESSISKLLLFRSPSTDEEYDESFQTVALWVLAGVKVDPGKYSLEVSAAIITLMEAVPEEVRDESWADRRKMIQDIHTMSSAPVAKQWTRKSGDAK